MPHERRLEEANASVLSLRKEVNKELYPLYHIAPYAGWSNGPAGLVFFKGLYHVFLLYNPSCSSSSEWGPWHWGHLTSEDMVHWRHHPLALAPGDDWDRDGCFSGCCIVHDEKLYIYYTGHHWLCDTLDENHIYQVQCMAVSEDGFAFEKRGIVVKPPAGFTHFKDPKVWFCEDRWWMICGGRDSKNQGQVLLYSTDDPEDWDDSTFSVLAKSEDRNVTMWDCPDFFPLQRNHILMFSPKGMKPSGYSFRNHRLAGTLSGYWRPNEPFTITSKFKEIDLGHDYHIPQSLLTPDGRRVIISSMGTWSTSMLTTPHNWCGMLTIPKEVILDEHTGSLHFHPIKEIESLRRGHRYVVTKTVEENSQMRLMDNCSTCEVIIAWNMEVSSAEKYGLWLGQGLEIFVDSQTKRIVLNRHYPENCVSGYRSCPLPQRSVAILRIFFDRSSVEVIVNNGEFSMTSRIYPQSEDRTLSAFAINGTACISRCDTWDIEASIVQ